MPWNNLGLLPADIVSMYPNADALDFGGDAVITEAIERAVNDVLDLMPERVYKLFTERVELEIMAGPAGGSETSYSLGLGLLAPVVVGSVRAYVQAMDESYIKPAHVPAYLEDNYTDNITLSGANNEIVTFTPGTIQKNNFYMVTYAVDVSNLTAFKGAARIAQYRAGYELGDKLYTLETGNWSLVEEYKALSESLFKSLKAGKIIFDEVRRLRFARDIEPETTEMSILRKHRS